MENGQLEVWDAVPREDGTSRSAALPEFDDFWRLVESAGISVQMHNSDSGDERYVDDWESAAEFDGFAMSKLRGFIYEESRNIFDTLAAFIAHGVFERFPGVRVGVVENGGSWAHRLIDVFDRVYRKRPYDFDDHPAEVFRRHVGSTLSTRRTCQSSSDLPQDTTERVMGRNLKELLGVR